MISSDVYGKKACENLELFKASRSLTLDDFLVHYNETFHKEKCLNIVHYHYNRIMILASENSDKFFLIEMILWQ